MKKYFSKTDLKNRGWSRKKIQQDLVQPDIIKSISLETEVHLYSQDRVLAVEETEQWQAWKYRKEAIALKRHLTLERRQIEKQECLNSYPLQQCSVSPKTVELINSELKAFRGFTSSQQIEMRDAVIDCLTTMIEESDGYFLPRLFVEKDRQAPSALNSPEKIEMLKANIRDRGWLGRPLIDMGDGQLLTGAHRLAALRSLYANNECPDLIVPVFNLDSKWAIFWSKVPYRDQCKVCRYSWDILRGLCETPFTRFVTGFDWR